MKHINDFLEVTLYDYNNISLKEKQYSEESLLYQGMSMLSKPILINQNKNVDMLFHSFSYKLYELFIDPDTYILNANGLTFYQRFEVQSMNFRYLFQYYSRYSEAPKITDDLYSEPLTPYTFYRFLVEFVDMVAFMPNTKDSKQKELSKLCQYAIFNSPKLCLYNTFSDLRNTLVKYLKKSLNGDELNSFYQIFESCFLKSIYHQPKITETKVRHNFRSILHLKKDQMPKTCPSYKKNKNFVETDLFLHERAAMVDKRWIYTDKQMEDDPVGYRQDAIQILLYTSKQISKYYFNKNPKGKALILLSFNASTQEILKNNKLYAIIHYLKKKIAVPLEDVTTEMLLPAVEKTGGRISISTGHDQKIPIFEIEFQPLMTNQHKNGEFKFNGTKIIYSLDISFFELKNRIPLSHKFFDSEYSSDNCVDFAVSAMINEWFKNMGEKPPIQFYTFIVDFALKHGIPVSYIYFRILIDLQICWTSSGSFLEAFVPILLTCYAITQKCKVIDEEQQSLESVFQSLKNKVPKLIMNALSKPDVIEKPAITQLLILLSFVHDPNTIEEYFQGIMNDAILNIFNSVVNTLKFVPTMKEARSEVMPLYSVASNLEFDPVISKNGIPWVDVDIESMINAMKVMLLRSEKLTAFFTTSNLPKFANHSESIRKDFASIAFNIAKAFCNHDPIPSSDQTFQFLGAYRTVWRIFGSEKHMSPEILFVKTVLNWLTEFGPSLIEWTTRAVEVDDFSVIMKDDLASSSIFDLFKIFNDTVKFLDNLQFVESIMNDILTSYATLSSSTARLYFCQLYSLVETKTYHILHDKYNIPREISVSQSYVVLNDLVLMKNQWKQFVDLTKKKYNVDPDISDPLNTYVQSINFCIKSFEIQSGIVVRNKLFDAFWTRCGSFTKKLFKFERENLNLARKIIEEECEKFYSPINNLLQMFRNKVIIAVFRGIENAIIESFLPFLETCNDLNQTLSFENFRDLLSVALKAVVNAAQGIENETLRAKAMNETSHLQWGSRISDKNFLSIKEVDIPDDDKPSQVIRAIVLCCLAASDDEKKYARLLAREFREVSLFDPSIMNMKEPERL